MRSLVRSFLLCGLTAALLAALVVSNPSQAEAQAAGSRQAVVSVARADMIRLTAIAAIKEDGRLYVRTGFSGTQATEVTWGPYTKLGSGDDWVSVDIAADTAGNLFLVAVKESGALYTRFARKYVDENGKRGWRWQPWVKQGASTWSTEAAPSIEANLSGDITVLTGLVLFSAIKADGRLYTRKATVGEADPTKLRGSWEAYVRHGQAGWAGADVALSGLGAHLIGVKDDGRLYTRAILPFPGATWGSFVRHGRSDWDPAAPPVIDSHGNNTMTMGAIKADGRMYTREGELANVEFRWADFTRHGLNGWVAMDVYHSRQGYVVLGVKDSGAMYSRQKTPGGLNSTEVVLSPWTKHGLSNWAAVKPALANDHHEGSEIVILAVKADGAMYIRINPREVLTHVNNWQSFQKLGRSDWRAS